MELTDELLEEIRYYVFPAIDIDCDTEDLIKALDALTPENAAELLRPYLEDEYEITEDTLFKIASDERILKIVEDALNEELKNKIAQEKF